MGDIELNTPDRLEYSFFPNNNGYVRFKVRAPNDAHVALSQAAAECDPMYEIFIGGWGNQRSVIRKNRTKPDKAEVPTPNILNPGEFRTFWIRWDANTISCGCENNPQPFISWTDTEYVPIRYVGVCTGWGASGSWIIHQGAPLGGFGGQQFGGAPPQNQQFGGGQQPGYQQQQPGQYGGYQPPPPQSGGQFGGQGGWQPPPPQPASFTQQQQFGGGQPGGYGAQPQQQQQFGSGGGGYGGGGHTWVPSNSGNVPPNAFVGGDDKGEPLYVARCNFQGALLPGKLQPSHRNAYVSWGGQEHAVPQYEVLCNFGGRWMPCNGGNIPPNAVTGGQCENGEPLYVGRVNHLGTLTIGKVQRSHGSCYIPYGGQELNFPQYEILVL